ncbi:MAG: FKBP-type peptidyl-prolyl cis-trans isomerase [Agarilytica sp.]
MARNLETLEGTEISVDTAVLAQGFEDGVNSASQLEDADLQKVMNDFRTNVNNAMQEKRKQEQEEQAKVAEENKTKGATFLEESKAKEGVVTLPSGLQYKILTEGTGAKPAKTDRVKVHYKGTLIDGTQFDSSYDRGQPAQFGVTQVIKGWTEALQLMKEGAKWQLIIPADLAYGEASRPKIPGNSVLLFDVELLEIVKKEEKPHSHEGEEGHEGHSH